MLNHLLSLLHLSRARFLELYRFAVAGVLGFSVDYGLLFVLTEYGGLSYLWSSAASFTASVLFNYWLCLVYVFRGAADQTLTRRILFFATSIVGLGLNQLCMWALVDGLGLYYMLAKIFATAIVMFWNYVTKRKAVRG